jgi:asparagine synthase (glutamine-hydrolysing)
MCGIAGFTGGAGDGTLQAMVAAIAHRGPDGTGFYSAPDMPVHLAHLRLAIVDLAGGDQPMWNEDGTVGVTFNGEIYNHLELRSELLARGHAFRSDHSDTEVLVHGYEEWGEGLSLRLNGMFAFAIIDRPRRLLHLARDRFGKKPLYYGARDGTFAFASELSALRRHPRMVTAVDRKSLQKLFAYGFIPAPRSLYQSIQKLPAGHHMTVDIDRPTEPRIVRYWQFCIEPAGGVDERRQEVLGEELGHLLSRAVKRRLMSDVPLGIFLSGGIDSSAVLAFAARHIPADQIETFSIGFREPTFDESAYARAVAGHFGTRHNEKMFGVENARDLVPTVLERLDEPFGDPSILPTYQLCEFARSRITVALGGDGGDEMFAGYDPFKALAAARWYSRTMPSVLRSGVRRLADLMPVSDANMGLDFKIKRGLRGAGFPSSMRNPAWLGPLEPRELGELFAEEVDPQEVYGEAIAAWEGSTARHDVDRTLEFYTRFYLQDDILAKADRASMMVSLELRSPFLDYDLVDFVRQVPHQLKYRSGTTKVLLKTALRGVLPDWVLDRKKKGFGIPLTRWLKTWDPADFARWRLPHVDDAWARRRLDEHRVGRRDDRMFLWCMLALQRHALDLPPSHS